MECATNDSMCYYKSNSKTQKERNHEDMRVGQCSWTSMRSTEANVPEIQTMGQGTSTANVNNIAVRLMALRISPLNAPPVIAEA